MVKKEHVKIIVKELRKRGSKTLKAMIIAKDHSLTNLLSLACGGKYALNIEDIVSIGNIEFAISEARIKKLCKHSPTREEKL